MTRLEKAVMDICSTIEGNIALAGHQGRGLLSQNILSQLRNLVEHVAALTWAGGADKPDGWDTICNAVDFIQGKAKYASLRRLHNSLRSTASHYTLDADASERLVLHYYDSLLQIRLLLKSEFGLNVLQNLEDYPLDTDDDCASYYRAIADVVDNLTPSGVDSWEDGRFRVIRCKPFVVNGRTYYELSLSPVVGGTSKGERLAVFSSFRVITDYAIRISLKRRSIPGFATMPVVVVVGYQVSIRPCELTHLSEIVCRNAVIRSSSEEYKQLMGYLTETNLSLLDVIELCDEEYLPLMSWLFNSDDKSHIASSLHECRRIVLCELPGANVLRYLLHTMENEVLRRQLDGSNPKLSGLCLSYGCIPFDQMPYATSLKGHNPRLSALLQCISPEGREHEFLARRIKNEAERNGNLYVPASSLSQFGDIDSLIDRFNGGLYRTHQSRRIEFDKGHYFIKGYESDVKDVISKLLELSENGVDGYAPAVRGWLATSASGVDDPAKREMLPLLFQRSCVALVYGSAGTGKSTLVRHVADYLADKDKLFLANTNPAVDNLKRKVTTARSEFCTIAKHLIKTQQSQHYTLLVIDECSTIGNADMAKLLSQVSFDLLMLVGDVHQIQSISFGNWFGIARSFVPKESAFELTTPFRSTDENLLKLWDTVRKGGGDIVDHLARWSFSAPLRDGLSWSGAEDEIVLCLNYDGLYGINNVNRLLQSNNPNPPVFWNQHCYKVGDPVLFLESRRFSPVLYNNLKGWIAAVNLSCDGIAFDLELDKAITALDVMGRELRLISTNGKNHSIVRICVDKLDPDKEDADDDFNKSVVPFQVAYAVSIHKAQGLEYDSVRVIVSNEVGENITHNIFYTAITRARKRLKVYWSPETEKRVLSGLELRSESKSVGLLKGRYGNDLNRTSRT